MAEQHKPCNGTGETQTVNPASGDVNSAPCKPCGGNGVVPSPQHGGNNKG
jgi:DnaJ-class molecular chaperone